MRGRQRVEPQTLGGLAQSGLDVWAWCWSCPRSAVLSTSGLIERLGAGFPIPAIGGRLRCSVCGGRRCEARPNWPTYGMGVGHGASRSRP